MRSESISFIFFALGYHKISVLTAADLLCGPHFIDNTPMQYTAIFYNNIIVTMTIFYGKIMIFFSFLPQNIDRGYKCAYNLFYAQIRKQKKTMYIAKFL